MKYLNSESLKFIIGWIVVFAIRLLPFRPPNVEPILATLMPFSKKYGILGGFAFGFMSIFLFDLTVGKIGMWTWITAASYGLLGVGAYWYFHKRENTTANYLTYGIIGTIFYDVATGLSIGPLFFDQPFIEALIGQIPFTAMHLIGTITLSLTVSPAIYRWVITNKRLELSYLFTRIKPRTSGI